MLPVLPAPRGGPPAPGAAPGDERGGLRAWLAGASAAGSRRTETLLMIASEPPAAAAAGRPGDAPALLARTGFSMPHVDDPFDFGRSAASRAAGEAGAMRGRPTLALVAD
jgi:hypothetical protein